IARPKTVSARCRAIVRPLSPITMANQETGKCCRREGWSSAIIYLGQSSVNALCQPGRLAQNSGTAVTALSETESADFAIQHLAGHLRRHGDANAIDQVVLAVLAVGQVQGAYVRSEERRVGKEC